MQSNRDDILNIFTQNDVLLHKKIQYTDVLVIVAAAVFIFFLYGTIPYLSSPSDMQSIIKAGSAMSLANEFPFGIYQKNVGIPFRAPITFGFPLVYLNAALIDMGMHTKDAYSVAYAIWLFVALTGAWRFSLLLGANRINSVLGSVLWMILPVVFQHAIYSAIGLSFALLPFYFFVAIKYFSVFVKAEILLKIKYSLYYILTLILALFMDGYGFMMYFTGSSIILMVLLIFSPANRLSYVKYLIPIHFLGAGFAYVCYTFYIGSAVFPDMSINFFRSYAADVSFFIYPTEGIHWLMDVLKFSKPRSETLFWGDNSVWVTTFILPILLISTTSLYKLMRFNIKIALMILIVIFVGFYMSLGPNIKINLTKPQAMDIVGTEIKGRMLYDDAADKLNLISTGNSMISSNLPGFKNMRASYRWITLSFFGFWVLIIIWQKFMRVQHRKLLGVALFVLILIYLPDLNSEWHTATNTYHKFNEIDNILVNDMKQILRHDEIILILPFQNDYYVNYIASMLGIRSYNIGEDKNLDLALQHWPLSIPKYHWDREYDHKTASDFVEEVIAPLFLRDVDSLIIPFFNTATMDFQQQSIDDNKEKLRHIVSSLKTKVNEVGFLKLIERPLYIVVRFRHDSISSEEKDQLLSNFTNAILDGKFIRFGAQGNDWTFMKSGFSGAEKGFRWSSGNNAELIFDTEKITGKDTIAKFDISPLLGGGLKNQRVKVLINDILVDQWVINKRLIKELLIKSEHHTSNSVKISFEFIDAVAPKDLGIGNDPRKLAIAFRTIQFDTVKTIADLFLSFGDLGNDSDYITSGFSGPEKGFRWTDGHTAVLRFNANNVPNSLAASFDIHPLLSGDILKKQRVKIFVNGNHVTDWELQVREQKELLLPYYLIKNQQFEITFLLPDAISPKELGINNDTRQLSVAFHAIQFFEK